MPARLRLVLGVLVVLAVAGLAAALAFAPSHERAAPAPAGYAGYLRPPAAPPVRFALRDTAGARATAADYRGKVYVIAFMYSTCRDTCPLTAQQIRGALDDLPRPVPVLAVSVDPSADTAFHVRRFLLAQELLGRMRYLVGTRAQLAAVWRQFGIAPQTATASHTASVVIVDRRGRQRLGFPTSELTPEGLAHDLRLLGAERA
jgi:protein SCO1/2